MRARGAEPTTKFVDGSAKKHEGRACASSPRHVLSCCYRDWDQDTALNRSDAYCSYFSSLNGFSVVHFQVGFVSVTLTAFFIAAAVIVS